MIDLAGDVLAAIGFAWLVACTAGWIRDARRRRRCHPLDLDTRVIALLAVADTSLRASQIRRILDCTPRALDLALIRLEDASLIYGCWTESPIGHARRYDLTVGSGRRRASELGLLT